jgi:hypothetical protein
LRAGGGGDAENDGDACKDRYDHGHTRPPGGVGMQSVIRRFEAAFNTQDAYESLALLQLGFAPEALAKILRRRL